MLKRKIKEMREVFYLNREATKTLHSLLPDYEEYCICKVCVEVPVLYIDIPDFCPTYIEVSKEENVKHSWLKRLLGRKQKSLLERKQLHPVSDMGKYKQVQFSDNVLCVSKEYRNYEILNRERIDEFKSKFTKKDWSVEIEVGKKSNDSYSKGVKSLSELPGIHIHMINFYLDYHDCKIRLYVALDKYAISPDFGYELDKDGEYAILTLELPESILCSDTQEGKCYYKLDRLTKEGQMKFEEFKSKAIMKKELLPQ